LGHQGGLLPYLLTMALPGVLPISRCWKPVFPHFLCRPSSQQIKPRTQSLLRGLLHL
jgi:hypothetical protein